MRKPSHLDKKAYSKFEELYDLVKGSFREGDENLLAVLANAYMHYDMANVVMKDRGPVLAGETMVRQNPAWNVVKDAVKIIESLSVHFGLSAKARGDGFEIKLHDKNPIEKLKAKYN